MCYLLFRISLVADAVSWAQVIKVLLTLVIVTSNVLVYLILLSENPISSYLVGLTHWRLLSLLHLDSHPGRLLLVLQVQLPLPQLLMLLVLLLDVPVHVPAQI